MTARKAGKKKKPKALAALNDPLLNVAQAGEIAGFTSGEPIARACAAGKIEGAFKLRRGSWLLPTSSLVAYMQTAEYARSLRSMSGGAKSVANRKAKAE